MKLTEISSWLSAQLHTAPVQIMLLFLLISALFALFCRFVWRRGKRFQEP
jgi:hypothetical protein